MAQRAAMDLYREIGERIGELRRSRGLSQERLAERARIATSYVAHIESGGKRPTLEVLARIAVAVEVPLWRLLEDRRPFPEEAAWRQAAGPLFDLLRSLPAADVEALAAVARRLKAKDDAIGARPPDRPRGPRRRSKR